MRTLEAIVWDQDKVCSSLQWAGLGCHPTQWETLLIYPPEPGACELAPVEGMAGITQIEPVVNSP